MKIFPAAAVLAVATAAVYYAQQPDRAFLPFRHVVIDASPAPPPPGQRFHGDCKGAGDIDAQALPDVYWLYPKDRAATQWERVRIGTAPATSHRKGQGYTVAKLDERAESALISSAEGVFSFTPPANPRTGGWPRRQITNDSSEEGIDVGDGKLEVATPDKEGHTINWWRNPGTDAFWHKTRVGKTERWADRVGVADTNGNGRPDIIVSEEIFYYPASVYWFENPGARGGEWTRHTIVTQYATNAMDLADVNGDGQMDIVTGEHRGSRKLASWENCDHGARWVEHVNDTGKENHLGARVFRLTPNGPLAIAGIACDTYRFLHLWTLAPREVISFPRGSSPRRRARAR